MRQGGVRLGCHSGILPHGLVVSAPYDERVPLYITQGKIQSWWSQEASIRSA